MAYPQDYKYTKEHEWIQVKGNVGTVGITDYAQQQLGDIVHLTFPEVGKQLKADEAFGGIDSVKSFSDLFSPASGKVVELNDSLTGATEKVNNDAHAAWMIKLELSNPKEVDRLMSAEDYEKYIAEEK